jgi:hypothetical protein
MKVQDVHRTSLAISTAISEYYVSNFIAPLDVIRILTAAGVRFMLVGAHAVGGWVHKPRATQDVDVIIAARGLKKGIAALQAAYPHLQVEDHEVVIRMRDPETGEVVIDVIKPIQPLFREALKHTHTVQSEEVSYQIPSLEMALAMKFAPMISLTRGEEDRHIDAHDFIHMVKSNPEIDLKKLAKLGDLVYHNGGRELVEKVRQVRAGEKLQL